LSSAQTIRILCPNLRCRRILAVPANARGKVVVCKSCGTRITVPARGSGKEKTAPTEASAGSKPKK